jgi:nucleotide-binding universal stress UspA family protein
MIQPIHKIAVPIDFSPYSNTAVSYAAILAKFFNAALVLINVIDQRGLDRCKRLISIANTFNAERFEKERLADREKRLRSSAAEIGEQGLQIEPHVVIDLPFRGILKCVAHSKSNLLVISTKGRTNTADVLVGSCAEKLFRRSPVPVLSIPAAFVTLHQRKSGKDSAVIKES